MEYLDSCGQKVEAFIRSSDQFQHSCNTAFETVDARGVGKVSVEQAATACVFFFKVFKKLRRFLGGILGFACIHSHLGTRHTRLLAYMHQLSVQ